MGSATETESKQETKSYGKIKRDVNFREETSQISESCMRETRDAKPKQATTTTQSRAKGILKKFKKPQVASKVDTTGGAPTTSINSSSHAAQVKMKPDADEPIDSEVSNIEEEKKQNTSELEEESKDPISKGTGTQKPRMNEPEVSEIKSGNRKSQNILKASDTIRSKH